MHRSACSCIKLRHVVRILCHESSSAQDRLVPRFVNAQQLSNTFGQGGRVGAFNVSLNNNSFL